MRISIVNPNNLGRIEGEEEYVDVFELSTAVVDSCWSPSLFDSTRVRSNENWKACSLLVLDVDSGLTVEAAKKEFKDYQHIVAFTRSHGKLKGGVKADRFRVVLFFDRECKDSREYASTWEQAKLKWPFIDPACKDLARFYYPCLDIASVRGEGQLVTLLKPPQAPPQTSAPSAIPRENKGDLWKSTLDFLLNGAPQGLRRRRLLMAAGNMREQGYTKEEVIVDVSRMIASGGSWAHKELAKEDKQAIDDVFKRDMKYAFKVKEEDAADLISAAELWEETRDYLSDKNGVSGSSTGFTGLDDLLGGGFRRGELTVLMAQAKTGKNTLLHNVLFKALESGVSYGYASREMAPASEVVPDLLCMKLKRNIYKESFNSDYFKVAAEWPVYFAPGFGYLSHDRTDRFFETCRGLGVEHFIYDHFHRGMQYEDYGATEKHIRFLKGLTKKWDCHVALVVQPKLLQEGQKLGLDTLRGGAIIGQELNNLLILTRMRDQQNVSKLELEAARHKLAKLGKIYLKYDPETILMTEIDKGSVSESTSRLDKKIEWGKK